MRQYFTPALRMIAVMTVLTGLIYPLLLTGLCQAIFHARADGSLIRRNGVIVGSSLIGQAFSKPQYFQNRPSAAGSGAGYDPTASTGSNFGPTNAQLIRRVGAAVAAFRRANPDYRGPIPADLWTASGSGLDPDVSPDAALAQVPRVAAARHLSEARVRALVLSHIEGRQWDLFGEPRVNVLELNLALEDTSPGK